MHQTDAAPDVPHFSVVWEAGRMPDAVDSVDHAAHYAMALAHALSSAGYPPRRLEIAVQEPSRVELDLDVHGDVPGLDQASFGSIARIAVSGCRIWQALPTDAEVRLRATLAAPAEMNAPPLPRASGPVGQPDGHVLDDHESRGTLLAMIGLLAMAVLVYLVAHPPFQSTPAPAAAPTVAAPTIAPTAAATVAPTQGALQLLLDEHFLMPSMGWPNDASGSAWFGAGGYHLIARNPGQFVAVGVPLGARVQDVVVSATFAKAGGPEGGGYGLIVRDQAPSPLDGRGQFGRFLVFEVGDRGEFGVWQRDGVRWVDVVPWTHSEAVRPGRAQNDLIVAARGDQLSFIVNGQALASFSSSALPPVGNVALFTGGDLNEAAISHLTIQVP